PLKELVEWRADAPLTRYYGRLWSSLPLVLRSHLQDPKVQADMHRKAVQIVYELGPAAIRPLNSSLCQCLDDLRYGNYALRSLYWTIPESAQAIASVTNWLSNPTHGELFGSMDGWDLYPLLPNITSSLINCLHNQNIAREA